MTYDELNKSLRTAVHNGRHPKSLPVGKGFEDTYQRTPLDTADNVKLFQDLLNRKKEASEPYEEGNFTCNECGETI